MNRRQRRIRARENEANRISNAVSRRIRPPRVISENNATRVMGSEMLGNVAIQAAANIYTINLQMLSNGGGNTFGLGGTWLGRQASLFNRVKILRCSARYVPFVPTSTSGRIIGAFTADFSETPTSAQQISQFEGAREAPVWRELSVTFQTQDTKYIVAGTANPGNGTPMTEPGSFLFLLDNGAGSSSVACGTLYLDYHVEFSSRASFAQND